MNTFRRVVDSDDDGISIVEVVVAMVIFALIITGTLYTMLSILQTTRDSRAQQVAANLAAQDIDLARDYDDLFRLLPTTYTVPLNGDIFTVTRQTEWVNGSGNDVQCGSGGAALSYKRVNVVVTWDRMRANRAGVRADTVIDPNSRITDPTKGTILVFVKTGGGVGSPGVVVKATASATANGAVTPSPSTAVTDASGCAYILKVQPGNYDISLTHTSNKYVDEKQDPNPSKILGVQKNATASVGFQYDLAGAVQVTYASNYVAVRPKVASNMKTTFSNTYGSSHIARQTGDTFLLHPFASGYQVLAGDEEACLANDPQEWKANGTTPIAPPSKLATAEPGKTLPAEVPMGVIKITRSNNSGGDKYLRAVSADAPGNGNPGCTTRQVLRWSGKIISNSSPVIVALPYGSWRLYFDKDDDDTGTSASDLAQGNGTVTQLTNDGSGTLFGALTGVVNVDPRVP